MSSLPVAVQSRNSDDKASRLGPCFKISNEFVFLVPQDIPCFTFALHGMMSFDQPINDILLVSSVLYFFSAFVFILWLVQTG